jgi:four helix bundle protein
MDFVDMVYATASTWPEYERFGLCSQVRRAAVSVPANIAEGFGRSGPREFMHHLSIAHGSLLEAETILLVASRQQLVPTEQLDTLLECSAEVGKVVNGLQRSLKKQLAGADH